MNNPRDPTSAPETSNVTQTVSGENNSTFQIGSIGGSLAFGSATTQQPVPSPATAPPQVPGENVRLLFLGANPSESVRLRLDTEVREIETALAQADLGRHFELHQKWAVRASDLQGHLLRHRPHLLHFSGHGGTNDAIYLEGHDGRPHAVEAVYLAKLLGQFSRQLRCVVLNACYSESQARAIAGQVDAVIGMSSSVSDQAAIRFSSAFYQALAFGESVASAYDLACSDVEICEVGEDSTPRLLTEHGPANEIVFVKRPI